MLGERTLAVSRDPDDEYRETAKSAVHRPGRAHAAWRSQKQYVSGGRAVSPTTLSPALSLKGEGADRAGW